MVCVYRIWSVQRKAVLLQISEFREGFAFLVCDGQCENTDGGARAWMHEPVWINILDQEIAHTQRSPARGTSAHGAGRAPSPLPKC